MAVSLKKLMRPLREGDTAAKVARKIKVTVNSSGKREILSAELDSSDGRTSYEPRITYVAGHQPTVRTRVKVSCTCSDFLYTFAYANKKHGALSGKPPPLKEVKGTGQRAPRNPSMQPGCCKHIRGLAKKAIRKGLIEEYDD